MREGKWHEIGQPRTVVMSSSKVELKVNVPTLAPEVVFYVFLPPLLYYAAYFIAPDDLRASARPIRFAATGGWSHSRREKSSSRTAIRLGSITWSVVWNHDVTSAPGCSRTSRST